MEKQTKVCPKHRDLESVVSMHFYLDEVDQRNMLKKKRKGKEKKGEGGREGGRENWKGCDKQWHRFRSLI